MTGTMSPVVGLLLPSTSSVFIRASSNPIARRARFEPVGEDSEASTAAGTVPVLTGGLFGRLAWSDNSERTRARRHGRAR